MSDVYGEVSELLNKCIIVTSKVGHRVEGTEYYMTTLLADETE